MARLEQVLKGIKAVQAKGLKRKERLPISITHLAKLREVWSSGKSNFDGTMLWAVASLCFMRSGELTIPTTTSYNEGAHLNFSDVTVDCMNNPRILRVQLKTSKTDPFRVGVNIYVGRTGNLLCPVTAILRYMVARGVGAGPFFRFENRTPLTRMMFVYKVKEALTILHTRGSFRSGAATTAVEQGISDATIKLLGRWKSNAYQVYIKTPREQLASYSCCVGGNAPH